MHTWIYLFRPLFFGERRIGGRSTRECESPPKINGLSEALWTYIGGLSYITLTRCEVFFFSFFSRGNLFFVAPLSSPLIYSSSALPCTLHSSWIFLGFKEKRRKEKKEKKTFCWFAYVFPLPSHLFKGLDCPAMQTGRQYIYIYLYREREKAKKRAGKEIKIQPEIRWYHRFQVMDFGISAKGVVMGLCVQYCVVYAVYIFIVKQQKLTQTRPREKKDRSEKPDQWG